MSVNRRLGRPEHTAQQNGDRACVDLWHGRLWGLGPMEWISSRPVQDCGHGPTEQRLASFRGAGLQSGYCAGLCRL
jgi:hypothetical protein